MTYGEMVKKRYLGGFIFYQDKLYDVHSVDGDKTFTIRRVTTGELVKGVRAEEVSDGD